MRLYLRQASSLFYSVIVQAAHAVQTRPTTLLYPTDYWPVSNDASQEVFDEFVDCLEHFLGVTRKFINLNELWRQHSPQYKGRSFSDYFSNVFEWVANPDQRTGFFKDFLEQYEATMGKVPALNPQLRFKR